MNIKYPLRLLVITLSLSLLTSCGTRKIAITPKPEMPQEPMVNLGVVAEFSGSPQQLTFGTDDNGIGSFHPSGDYIVFQSNRDGHWQIYQLDLTNMIEDKLIESEANDENPQWTNDGTKILFVSDRDSQGKEFERDIYLYDIATAQTTRIVDTPGDDWYPVVFDNESFLFLSERNAEPSETDIERINSVYRGYFNKGETIEFISSDIDPSCPARMTDGKLLVRTKDAKLALFDNTNGSLEILTPPEYKIGHITYNPLRNFAAFTARSSEPVYKLYLFNLSDRTLQYCETNLTGDIRFPQFSFDGQNLLYSQEVDGRFQLFIWKLAQ